MQRLRLKIRGVVQGVGFRPFLYGHASRLGLIGFARNTSEGVLAEVQGPPERLREYQDAIAREGPPLCVIKEIEIREIALGTETNFRIDESRSDVGSTTYVPPDTSTCEDCLRELFDPGDRRFRYPFINCTNCGPRFTITRDLPYDRSNTTMAIFEMCVTCRREYEDPADRRFHAEPNACATCGPELTFRAPGEAEVLGEDALLAAQLTIAHGGVIAMKGVGGFHLVCDARNDSALAKLRTRKGRIDKPFALMCRDLSTAVQVVHIGDAERLLLAGSQRPIVLLEKKSRTNLSGLVAPGNQFLGVMLPYSPIHCLLLNPARSEYEHLDVLVMTSGNLSDEPIATGNSEALERLGALADAFLIHNRDIFVPCDDSVMRIANGRELPIRRSRGYAPMPVNLPFAVPQILAVGGEIKNTFCLTTDDCALMSQHIGDMENIETLEAFQRSVDQISKLFRVEPEIVACDKHPAYLSSRWAKENAGKRFPNVKNLVEVQHHHAHIASVMAENGLNSYNQVIGFAFDGTGYGDDGAIWGGEVLLADYTGFERAAHLQYFPLPGGDASIRKPYRAALSYLKHARIDWNESLACVAACTENERKLLAAQMDKNLNVVPTSSMGRLFDVVASIAGVRQTVTYEAQGAIELEAAMIGADERSYSLRIEGSSDAARGPIRIAISDLIAEVVRDVLNKVSIAEITAKFHNAVAGLIVNLSLHFRERTRLNTVALSGGCFQNVALLDRSLAGLRENGFDVITHRHVPPNDGGLALGQAVVAGFKSAK